MVIFFLLPLFPEESLEVRRSKRPAMIAQFHLNAAPSLTDHPFDSSTPHKPKTRARAHAHRHTQTNHTHTVSLSLLHTRTHTLCRRRLSEQCCLAAPYARSAPMNEAGGQAGRQAASPPRRDKRSSTPVGVNAKQTGAAFKDVATPMQSLFFFLH